MKRTAIGSCRTTVSLSFGILSSVSIEDRSTIGTIRSTVIGRLNCNLDVTAEVREQIKAISDGLCDRLRRRR